MEDAHNRTMRLRIEQALRQLPLPAADILATAARLFASNVVVQRVTSLQTDAPFFDFQRKISAVASHFARYGLTPDAYLRAAIKQPSLFYQSPVTLIGNIEGVAEHFRDQGLSLHNYVRAAVKQPSLFCMCPATIIANVEGVVEHFRDQGLSLHNYVRAAIKEPPLFYQSPSTIVANVEAVPAHFRGEGLSLADYLLTVVKQPSLFYRSPATVIGNIEAVVECFRDEGLHLRDYVRAAVKRPPLFCMCPATIIRHVNLIIGMRKEGLVRFGEEEGTLPVQPLRQLFEFLVRNPQCLCLADDNYALRVEYARITGERPGGAALLTRPRRRIEADLAQALGHLPSPESGQEPETGRPSRPRRSQPSA